MEVMMECRRSLSCHQSLQNTWTRQMAVAPTARLVDPLAAPLPFALAQHVLLSLPGAGLRQVAKLDRLRRFEAGDPAATEVDQLALGESLALFERDERL